MATTPATATAEQYGISTEPRFWVASFQIGLKPGKAPPKPPMIPPEWPPTAAKTWDFLIPRALAVIEPAERPSA